MKDKVIKAIDEIRPAIQEDGGDIEFVSLEGNTVKVRLRGACVGCPMAMITLKGGVENYLHEKVNKDIVVAPADE